MKLRGWYPRWLKRWLLTRALNKLAQARRELEASEMWPEFRDLSPFQEIVNFDRVATAKLEEQLRALA